MAMIERQFDDNCDGVQGEGVELDFAPRIPGGALTPALNAAGATNRSPSPMIGMRGDLDGPSAGLAAFGSQGSISSSAAPAPTSDRYYHQHHQGGAGPAGSSRLSPGDQIPYHLGGGAAAGGESNGAGRGRVAGENDTSSERRASSSAPRSAARSSSPYQGGGGVHRTPGASSPGERGRGFAVMERDRKLVVGQECVSINIYLRRGPVFSFLSRPCSRAHTHSRGIIIEMNCCE